jgi:hypothetical protein
MRKGSKKDPKNEVFSGFDLDDFKEGFTQFPHKWLDAVCSRVDNIAEIKVILYVIRHTVGYQETEQYKHITIDEFMYGRFKSDNTRMDNGTGLSEMSVRNGLKSAIKHGYLVDKENRSDMARIYKSYRLKLAYFD